MRAFPHVHPLMPGPRVHWNGRFARESAHALRLSHGVDTDEREWRPAAAFVRAGVPYGGQTAPRTKLARKLANTVHGKPPSIRGRVA